MTKGEIEVHVGTICKRPNIKQYYSKLWWLTKLADRCEMTIYGSNKEAVRAKIEIEVPKIKQMK